MSARTRIPDFAGLTVLDGRYKLESRLGAGSYGVVHRAVDLKHATTVAIKIMQTKSISESARDRLTKEVSVHRAMSDHPNVVTMHAAFEDAKHPGYYFIVLDFCSSDLFAKISDEKLYYRRDALAKSVFLQLLDAIEACHGNKVYHRDLKPENILTNRAGTEIYVTDFGLATDRPVGDRHGCGSIHYMSPECLGKEQGYLRYSYAANDVWALGIILINIITSRIPWSKALTSDASFCDFLLDENYLCDMLPISRSANTIFRQIFAYDPSERITIPELRKAIIALDTFFQTDDEIARAPEAVRQAASYCGHHVEPAVSAYAAAMAERILNSPEVFEVPRAPNPDAGASAFASPASDLSSLNDSTAPPTPAVYPHNIPILEIPSFDKLKLTDDIPHPTQGFWKKVMDIPRGLFSPKPVS